MDIFWIINYREPGDIGEKVCRIETVTDIDRDRSGLLTFKIETVSAARETNE